MYVYTVHIYTHILSIYVYVMEDITNTHIYSHPRHDLPRNILYIDVMRILQDIMGY